LISLLYYESTTTKRRARKTVIEIESDSDPYSMFLFAMRSPKTQEKCTGRLRIFFDFLGIPGESMTEGSKN
jgi:hypothetical protein